VQELAQLFIPQKQVDASPNLVTFSLHLGGDSSILRAVSFISFKRCTFPPLFVKRQSLEKSIDTTKEEHPLTCSDA
jgi:hypothetical protein